MPIRVKGFEFTGRDGHDGTSGAVQLEPKPKTLHPSGRPWERALTYDEVQTELYRWSCAMYYNEAGTPEYAQASQYYEACNNTLRDMESGVYWL